MPKGSDSSHEWEIHRVLASNGLFLPSDDSELISSAVKRPFSISNPSSSDVDELINLEKACWKNFDVNDTVIMNRIHQTPQLQWVARLRDSNKIIGCIYTQQIESCSLIMDNPDASYSNQHELHVSAGQTLQLIGVGVLPEYAHMQIGAALRDFVLLYVKYNTSIKEVIAFTRCSASANVAKDDYDDYVCRGQDKTLQFHTSAGAKIISVRLNYRPDDKINHGHAVLIRYDIRAGVVVDVPTSISTYNLLNPIHNVSPEHMVETILRDLVPSLHDTPIESILDMPFMSLGLDSLSLMEFQHRVQQAVPDTTIGSFTLFQYATPRKFISYLNSLKPYQQPLLLRSTSSASYLQTDVDTDTDTVDVEPEGYAICAMACRFADAPGISSTKHNITPEVFFQKLCKNYDAASAIPSTWTDCGVHIPTAGFLHPDIAEYFDPSFYGISMLEAKEMDPHQRILLDLTYELLVQADLISPAHTSSDAHMNVGRRCPMVDDMRSSIGVFVGLSNNEWIESCRMKESVHSPFNGINVAKASAANRISHIFGMHGPSLVVDTACSSSLAALQVANNALKCHDCDVAIVLSADLMVHAQCLMRRESAHMLAVDGRTKAFDGDADGYMRGEGAGGVLLKRVSDIKHDKCLAVLSSCVMNHNGQSVSYTAPSLDAQSLLLQAALHQAKVSPDDVGYIEAHGTGTKLGDPIELHALHQVFSQLHHQHHRTNSNDDDALIVGSVKTNIGHLEGAAGMAGLIKAIMILQSGMIPATLHIQHLNPLLPQERSLPSSAKRSFRFPSSLLPYPSNHKKVVGVSCFGSGGTNLHAVLKLPSSSTTQYTSSSSSSSHIVDNDVSHDKNVFLFSGQGNMMVDVGREYYDYDEVYAATMKKCSMTLADIGLTQPSLLEAMYHLQDDDVSVDIVSHPVYMQVAIVAMECSLLMMWRHKGVHPDVVIGHSIGEYAAAVAVGVFTIEQAVTLAYHRAVILHDDYHTRSQISSSYEEAMLAIKCTAIVAHDAIAFIKQQHDPLLPYEGVLEVAAINGENAVAIAGHKHMVEACRVHLSSMPSKNLPMKQAFHTSLMTRAAETYGHIFDAYTSSSLSSPSPSKHVSFVSTMTGGIIEDMSILSDKSYWMQQMCQPVLFKQALQYIDEHSIMYANVDVDESSEKMLFLELGPQAVLSSLARLHFVDHHHSFKSSIGDHKHDGHNACAWSIYHPQHHYRPVYIPWRQVHHDQPSSTMISSSLSPSSSSSLSSYNSISSSIIQVLEKVFDHRMNITSTSTFLSLGMDSLTAIAFRHMLCTAFTLPLHALHVSSFTTYAAIADLARHIHALSSTSDHHIAQPLGMIVDDADEHAWGSQLISLPALSMQQGIFYQLLQESSSSSSHSFLETFHWDVHGHVDIHHLESSVKKLMLSYPQLLSTFDMHALPHPLQTFPSNDMVMNIASSFQIHHVDYSSYDDDKLHSAVSAYLAQEQQHNFIDISCNHPLFRISLISMPSSHAYPYSLVWTFHHLLIDGFALKILLHELSIIYADIHHDIILNIDDIRWDHAKSYANILSYEHNLLHSASMHHVEERKRLQQYWHQPGINHPSHSFLGHYFADMIVDVKDEDVARVSMRIVDDIARKMESAASSMHLPLASMYHAIWCITYLCLQYPHTINEDDMMETWYGCTLINRSLPVVGCDEAVGLALNTIPFHVTAASTSSISAIINNVHHHLTSSLSHESYPLTQILSHHDDDGSKMMVPMIFDYQQESWHVPLSDDVYMKHVTLLDRIGCPLSVRIVRQHEHVTFHATSEYSMISSNILHHMQATFMQVMKYIVSIDTNHLDDHNIKQLRSSAMISSYHHHECHVVDQEHVEVTVDDNDHLHDALMVHQQQNQDTAIVCGDQHMSYHALNMYTIELADHIRSNIIMPSSSSSGIIIPPVIAIVMDRGWEQVMAMHAVLACGAAYLPIDAGLWPSSRIEYVLRHSQATGIITTETCYHRCLSEHHLTYATIMPSSSNPIMTIFISSSTASNSDSTYHSPLFSLSAHNLAYLIYTSGSTGTPKGVCGHHRGALNTIIDLQHRYGVSHHDRIFALSSASFDLSVYDIFGMMRCGGMIVYPDPNTCSISIPDPEQWLRTCQQHQVTMWDSVPALMEILVTYLELLSPSSSPLPSLRLIFLSGDKIPTNLPSRIWRIFKNPSLRIICMGGATEASIWSNYFEVSYPGDDIIGWQSIPYGRPLANQQMYVMDDHFRHCPLGSVGTIYISGVGVAHGYRHNKLMTDKHFHLHPITGELLFRTGDLGRIRHWTSSSSSVLRMDDGNVIEILGREDHQVKLRGYRIELGEIEAAIIQAGATHVQSALVTVQQDELCAYIVYRSSSSTHEQHDVLHAVKRHCQEQLAAYMQPRHFFILSSMPLTSNGKVDRKQLPSPSSKSSSPTRLTSSSSHIDNNSPLATIWKKVLKLSSNYIFTGHENFFSFGGDSLKSVAVISEFRAIGISNLSIRDIFRYPVYDQFYHQFLANQDAITASSSAVLGPRVLGNHQHDDDQQPRRSDMKFVSCDDTTFPLYGMNVAHFVGLHTSSYASSLLQGGIAPQIYFEWKMQDEVVDVVRLETSLNLFIQRHEVFQSMILPTGHMHIISPTPRYHIPAHHIHQHPDDEELKKIRLSCMQANTFQFNVWPLFEVQVSNVHNSSSSMSIMHVRVSLFLLDAISDLIFRHELSTLYRGGALYEVPSIRYRDYTHTLATQSPSSADYQRAKDFWMHKLANLSSSLSFTMTSSTSALSSGMFENRHVWLEADEYSIFRQNCQRSGTTIPTALLGAYALSLYLHSPTPRPDKFLLNILFCLRHPVHHQVSRFVGNTSSTMLVEIDMTDIFASSTSWIAYLMRIGEELSTNLSYAAMSGLEVMAEFNRKNHRHFQAVAPFIFTTPIGVEVDDSAVMKKEWMFAETFFSERVPHTACVNAVKNDEAGRMCASMDSVQDLFEGNLMEKVFESYRSIIERLSRDNYSWKQTVTDFCSLHMDDELRSSSLISSINAIDDQSTATIIMDQDMFIEPLSSFEERIRACMGMVLQQPPTDISCGASLFSLGGNSLTAIQFLHQLQATMQLQVTVPQLFQNSSCRKLASLFNASCDGDRDIASINTTSSRIDDDCKMNVIELQAPSSTTSSSPSVDHTEKVLLMFNPAGASVLCYHDLVQAMDLTQYRVLGIDDGAILQHHQLSSSIDDVVAHCITAIDRYFQLGDVDHHDVDVCLLGWSYGGVIAAELGKRWQQLHASSRLHCKGLFLFDAPLLRPQHPHTVPLNVDSTAVKHFQHCTALLSSYYDKHDMSPSGVIPYPTYDYRPQEDAGEVLDAEKMKRMVVEGNMRIEVVPGDHWTMLIGENVKSSGVQVAQSIKSVYEC